MVQRQQRTKPELEEICLMALQGHLGLNHLDFIRIGPYRGPESWTWEVVEAGPDLHEINANSLTSLIRTFQENFDLKEAQFRVAAIPQ